MKHASRILVLAALALSLTLPAFAERHMRWNCNSWTLQSASWDGKKYNYKLHAVCNVDQHADDAHNAYGNYEDVEALMGLQLDVVASWEPGAHQATETLSFPDMMLMTNSGPDHVSHTEKIYGHARTRKAKCSDDPFATISGNQCPGNQFGDYYDFPYRGHVSESNGDVPPQVDGRMDPVFWAEHHIDPSLPAKLVLQSKEANLPNPQVTSPQNNQRFYSQGVTIRALIPGDYKDDKQICCQVEIQKQVNGQWLPPLATNKPNLDANPWTLSFADFAPTGYGWYRVRVAPTKYTQSDATPWSPYVQFAIWPKEVLEVPQITEPAINALYTDVLPIKISFNETSKKAGVQCCELQFQTSQRGVWQDALSKTDTRLTDNNTVHYDAKQFAPGRVRMRARFIPPAGEQQLQWGTWTEFRTAP